MALEHIRGRRVQAGDLAVVVGAGRSGLAAARLLRRLGAKTRLLDRNTAALDPATYDELQTLGIEVLLGEHTPAHFQKASFVVPSPGMPVAQLAHYLVPQSAGGPEVLAEMELAWRCLEGEPVLAVTGTSGKTTTVSLAAAMLQAQGYTVFLGGNIGTPLSEYVLSGRKADVLVLEVSSFQLQACSTFCPRVGVLLNITPNHLDYHRDMAEYTEAKFRLFRCQDAGDLAIISTDLQGLPAVQAISARRLWLERTGRFSKSNLLGGHNQYNMEAAWQACRFFGVSQESAAHAVASFRPLPHRLEMVRRRAGVLFVNDSKCTTVSALKVALEAFEQPVRLLCGGKFKGGDLVGLVPLVRKKVVEAALFGAGREFFEQAWQGVIPMSWHPSLQEALHALADKAVRGDVILLAPATASFDLYKNYQERGDDFKRIVGSLP